MLSLWCSHVIVPVNERDWGETDFRWTAWKALADMPASVWLQFRPLLAIAAIALLVGAIATVYLLRRGREKIAVVGLACGLIVFGLCMVSGIARIAPFFSLADAARFLNGRLGTNGQVLFEGSPGVASSLGFYLERKFAMVNQDPDPRIPLTGEQRNLFLGRKSGAGALACATPGFSHYRTGSSHLLARITNAAFSCLSPGGELRHLHHSFESAVMAV